MIDDSFWQNRRVLITGHTGFKGSWLALALAMAGARLFGYSKDIPTTPSLYALCRLDDRFERSTLADLSNVGQLSAALDEAAPEFIFHLAAQPLVLAGYSDPIGTLTTNILGTANLLEAARHQASVRAVVVVTTDKCYLNREWLWPYREYEALGGHDPYSASKAAAEIITACFRQSFFAAEGRVAIATARAGNVIGGGDWAADRLVPDVVTNLIAGTAIQLRNPSAVRPWQHVLEPISGYLLLARKLLDDPTTADAWNFGPCDADCVSVGEVVAHLGGHWGEHPAMPIKIQAHSAHEAGVLKLDSSRARNLLLWRQRWDLAQAVCKTMDWYRSWHNGESVTAITEQQIRDYFSA